MKKETNIEIKKVLVFGVTENPGGMESVIMNYYRHINREKIQFEFLCNTKEVAYEEEIKQLGGVVYRIPARRDGVRAFRHALRTFFDLHGSSYCAFWFNTCSLANVDYLKEAVRVGIPKRIVHCHNAANGDSFLRGCLHQWNRRSIKRLATDYWTCSQDANAWFFGEVNHIEAEPNYCLIQNAIPVREFLPNEAIREEYRQKFSLGNELVLGHVGRFHFQKNQKFLIPIVKELKKRNASVKLLLIGQGEDMEEVKSLAEKEEVADCLVFLGLRSDVVNCLQAMDVFVFPSLFEGLSIALLEAQAAGLPCVVSDTVSARSKVTDEVTFLSLKASPQEWAEAILTYQNTKKKDNTLLFEQSGFDIEKEAEKLEVKILGK